MNREILVLRPVPQLPLLVGRPGLDPGTLGLKEGRIWSDWSGGVGIIRESKKICPVVSDSSTGVGLVCGMKCGICDRSRLFSMRFTSGQRCTRSRRARAASRRRSQNGDFGHLLGWAEAVLDQPADVKQASQRPPRADEVTVDVGAVAGEDVAKMLHVSEREGGEVEERVALDASDQSTTPVTSSPATKTWSTCRSPWNEYRCPRPERSLSEPAIACDHVGGKDVVGDEPLALGVEL